MFSASQIDTVLSNTNPYWDAMDNKMIVTGFDTLYRWGQLLSPRQRFSDNPFKLTVNGVQTATGQEGATMISTYNQIPVIAEKMTAQDTISRLYVVDMDYCWLAPLIPLQYSEVGDTPEQMQLIGKHAKEGMHLFAGELVCTKFPNQGKVMDLK